MLHRQTGNEYAAWRPGEAATALFAVSSSGAHASAASGGSSVAVGVEGAFKCVSKGAASTVRLPDACLTAACYGCRDHGNEYACLTAACYGCRDHDAIKGTSKEKREKRHHTSIDAREVQTATVRALSKSSSTRQ